MSQHARDSDSISFGKGLLVVVFCAGAWLLFGVGLLAPLTPSEGNPTFGEITIFVGGPVALLFTAGAQVRRGWAWSAAAGQAVIITGLALWLLLSIWE